MRTLLVITTAGGFNYLKEAIESLRDPFDILVMDDSTLGEEMPRFCEERGIRFMTKPKPRGVTHSWNRAYEIFKESAYENCILSNHDVRFPKGFSTRLLQGLPEFDIVGPLTNRPGFQPKQRLPKDLQEIATKTNIDMIQAELEKRYGTEPWEQIDYWIGFCFAFTHSIDRFRFSKDHLFNPARVNVHNEGVLAQSIMEGGGRIAMCKTSYVFHWKGVSRKNSGPSGQGLWR